MALGECLPLELFREKHMIDEMKSNEQDKKEVYVSRDILKTLREVNEDDTLSRVLSSDDIPNARGGFTSKVEYAESASSERKEPNEEVTLCADSSHVDSVMSECISDGIEASDIGSLLEQFLEYEKAISPALSPAVSAFPTPCQSPLSGTLVEECIMTDLNGDPLISSDTYSKEQFTFTPSTQSYGYHVDLKDQLSFLEFPDLDIFVDNQVTVSTTSEEELVIDMETEISNAGTNLEVDLSDNKSHSPEKIGASKSTPKDVGCKVRNYNGVIVVECSSPTPPASDANETIQCQSGEDKNEEKIDSVTDKKEVEIRAVTEKNDVAIDSLTDKNDEASDSLTDKNDEAIDSLTDKNDEASDSLTDKNETLEVHATIEKNETLLIDNETMKVNSPAETNGSVGNNSTAETNEPLTDYEMPEVGNTKMKSVIGKSYIIPKKQKGSKYKARSRSPIQKMSRSTSHKGQNGMSSRSDRSKSRGYSTTSDDDDEHDRYLRYRSERRTPSRKDDSRKRRKYSSCSDDEYDYYRYSRKRSERYAETRHRKSPERANYEHDYFKVSKRSHHHRYQRSSSVREHGYRSQGPSQNNSPRVSEYQDDSEDVHERMAELATPVPYDIEHERKVNFLVQDRALKSFERRNVYAGNINRRISKTDLVRRFQIFGPIEKVTLHFREKGDSYAFIVFEDAKDAVRAVNEGNNDPNFDKLDLCFGGRRKFVGGSYVDFDANTSYLEENDIASSRPASPADESEFDALLKMARKQQAV